jgi:hypothetical protein
MIIIFISKRLEGIQFRAIEERHIQTDAYLLLGDKVNSLEI